MKYFYSLQFALPDGLSALRPRILVIDDDLASATIARLFLIKHGYQVDIATDLRRALKLLTTQKYQLILLDIRLPNGVEGIHVLHTLRSLEGYRNVPVIAFTAYVYLNAEVEFLQEGFDGYLSKPFSRKQLLQKIQEFVHMPFSLN